MIHIAVASLFIVCFSSIGCASHAVLIQDDLWMTAGLDVSDPSDQHRSSSPGFGHPWVMFDWAWNLQGDIEDSLPDRIAATQAQLDQMYQVLDVAQSSPSDAASVVIVDTLTKIKRLDVDGDRQFDLRVRIRNADDVIDVPEAEIVGETMIWSFHETDSRIVIDHIESGVFQGSWLKKLDTDTRVMSFLSFQDQSRVLPIGWQHIRNVHRSYARIDIDACSVTEARWRVEFEDSGEAVGEFVSYIQKPKDWASDEPFRAFRPYSGILRGAFRTQAEEIRSLDGFYMGVQDVLCGVGSPPNYSFWLSAFDGDQALLFRADMVEDGSLRGDFWSGNWHHETWTAERIEP